MSKVRIFDQRLNDSLDHLFRRAASSLRTEREINLCDIRVDLLETDGAYKVFADLPGVKKDDISLRVDGNIVKIDAHTNVVQHGKGNGSKVLRHERHSGSLSRVVTLAHDIDATKAHAAYSDGVLQIELPKKVNAVADAKLIKVQ
jgi:HSP20 family protein